ncbi:tetratricopeptide repeat protein [Flavobacterium sp. M31R6]|jgi:tetratricopeptide (TPR) repeat protein|uniref:tetratricopeptide repeat protein n=1 Tax=Flavobacterium sp. M31R6 TaxID=2739062 RepID=UPI001568FAF5|nr:tetratricopeptide repeat protein [Flavobacterium sp. M31R6]QKJ62277.1 tetratricopeptide repeat protein [Flavobacterium sp. M31R6]
MNEEHFLEFDEYLQGEMSVEERLAFEQQLKDQPDLAMAFETYKELHLHLKNKFGQVDELNDFKKNLKGISKEHFRKSKPKVIALKPWYYAVVASVAVLFGLFFLNQNSNPTFEDYNQPEMAFFTERGEANDNLKLAQDAFNAKRYKAAIPLFETILKADKSAEIQYFYGVALLEENRLPEAEAVFTSLEKGNSIYKNKAIWSLALTKLKQKDYKSCKELLLTIPEDYEGNDQVDALLNDLD